MIYVLVCNIVMLLLVLVWVEVLSVCDIFVGVNVVDYLGYFDCWLEYIVVFECMVNFVIKVGVEGGYLCVYVLLIDFFKVEIIVVGM